MANTDTSSNVDFSLVLASSVHDMKNSIGMLIASLETFIDENPPVNEGQAGHFNTFHYEASRINAELVQLLTLYRMQNNHLPLRIDQHYVIDVLEDQLARNHALLESKDVHITFKCEDNLEWYFDSDLVGSVVQNVIVNCSRYTKNELVVAACVDGDFLKITVADDGGGYPPAMLERPSVLVEAADVNDGDTHLGLYFSEKIAGMHKQKNRVGYVQLSNGQPLGGGCFNMYLP